MRKRTGLIARLKKLEQRQFGNPLKRRIVFAIKDMNDSDIVGVTDGRKLHLLRHAQEPVSALIRRAAEVMGAKVLFLRYGTPSSASERD